MVLDELAMASASPVTNSVKYLLTEALTAILIRSPFTSPSSEDEEEGGSGTNLMGGNPPNLTGSNLSQSLWRSPSGKASLNFILLMVFGVDLKRSAGFSANFYCKSLTNY